LPTLICSFSEPALVIDLFNAMDWRERLLGKWIIQGDQLQYQEGELIAALHKRIAVEIRNGLWDDPEFQLFWRQAQVNGYFLHEGSKYPLPKNFKIKSSQGYSPDLNKYKEKVDDLPNGHVEVLNPCLFSQFFVSYRCDENHQLFTMPGIIERNANKEIPVFISHALTQHQWAMLLTECKKYDVKLKCFIPQTTSASLSEFTTKSTCIIQSNDVDASVQIIRKKLHHSIVINISE
jgi:hypothetical protein